MELLALLLVLLVLWVVGCAIVLPIVVFRQGKRVDQLTARLKAMEHRLSSRLPGEAFAEERPIGAPAHAAEETPSPIVAAVVSSEEVAAPLAASSAEFPADVTETEGEGVESWIGRKALGWVAVILMLFATAFFIKQAFENNWVGPIGRISGGVAGAICLVLAGFHYHRKSWRLFSQMFTAAGVAILYLTTFGAFGYYHLLPQQHAAFFLIVLIVETAALAILYEAPAVALLAVIGALITPVLLHTTHDQYRSLFLYLTAVNLGVLGIAWLRRWPIIGSVSLLGSQLLFWGWHEQNYQVEKLDWAIGFQAAIFVIYLLYGPMVQFIRRRRAALEDLLRMLFNAGFFFSAAYVLLDDDYRVWMGSLAVVMALLYTAVAWLLSRRRLDDVRQSLLAMAIAAGFVAIAIPLEAGAQWIAVGWALQGLLLWWFGCRVRFGSLRAMGAAILLLGVGRMVFINTPMAHDGPFIPMWNGYAIPATIVTACVLALGVFAARYRNHLSSVERLAPAAATLCGIALAWLIVSVETYDYFQQSIYAAQSGLDISHGEVVDAEGRPLADVVGQSNEVLRRTAMMSLSVAWAVFATLVLVIGFALRSAAVRSAALLIFAVTLGKALLVDMADLPGFYRVAALAVLAMMMALAAWAYQRAHYARKIKRERT